MNLRNKSVKQMSGEEVKIRKPRTPNKITKVPPLIVELVSELPAKGVPFSADQRADFMDRLGLAFRFVYGKEV